MSSKLVIVESPAKAKTINKYLGSDYKVIPSIGHIRDLPAKNNSIDTENNFSMIWEKSTSGKKVVSEIKKYLKEMDTLILATDPDREGEAISWHIVQELSTGNTLKNKTIQRVTFNEITKNSIISSFQQPREININLVNAYLARRALDYLVGFNLSPVLWRKLPGSKSAGRVQSVALRLVCEKENQIENFVSQEYWNIYSDFVSGSKKLNSQLYLHNFDKLTKFSMENEEIVNKYINEIKDKSFSVKDIEKKEVKRNPTAPFITSTLQQEASRNLGYTASRTMQIAQKLYEGKDINGETVGLITYMRTDGTNLSQDAINDIRNCISKLYGEKYLSPTPNIYKTNSKNSQEAHEAIRPTNVQLTPDNIKNMLSDEEFNLYRLIWNRSVSCQMSQAKINQTTVYINDDNISSGFKATGSVIEFDGFMKVYLESNDNDKKDETQILPKMEIGDKVEIEEITPKQSFTMPPPRYTEASLVKKMEEVGIGRPSTYASIIKVLQDREYVKIDKKRFFPEDRGRIVTSFLELYFNKWIDYEFTASLEEKLDKISDDKEDYTDVLKDFWTNFHEKTQEMLGVDPAEIRKNIDLELGKHFFKSEEERKCTACGDGRLLLNFGKFGGYISCSNYPECNYSRELSINEGDQDPEIYPKHVGDIDENPLYIKKGPYGIYIELEAEKKKRKAIPKDINPEDIDFEIAKSIVNLPREVGIYPDTGEKIMADIGPFGPYLKLGKFFFTLKDANVLNIGINHAIDIISSQIEKKIAAQPKDLCMHPKHEEMITIQTGRYGPYLKIGKTNCPIPKELHDEKITDEMAIELVDKKLKTVKKTPAKKTTVKKTPAKKTATKKTTTKKATAKKTVTKKDTEKKI